MWEALIRIQIYNILCTLGSCPEIMLSCKLMKEPVIFLKKYKSPENPSAYRERGALMSGTMERKVKERNRNSGERPVLMLQCRISSVCPPWCYPQKWEVISSKLVPLLTGIHDFLAFMIGPNFCLEPPFG